MTEGKKLQDGQGGKEEGGGRVGRRGRRRGQTGEEAFFIENLYDLASQYKTLREEATPNR